MQKGSHLPEKGISSRSGVFEQASYGLCLIVFARILNCAGKRISAKHPACKSGLVLLCERFTQQFGQLTAEGAPSCLPLNDVAKALAVPRRRLYDILNVLEAVEVRAATCSLG